MGSYSYDRDVYSSSSYDAWSVSGTSKRKLNKVRLEENMLPNGKIIKSDAKTPIVIVLDVTGSNINFARLVYDKFPMFYTELEQKGYLEDFDISICAVGDAYTDDYPVQINDFAKGLELDANMENIVLESGGGGQGCESYELIAHYLANNTVFRKDANPMVFFIADEAPYSELNINQAKEIGLCAEKGCDPFKELNKKFKNNVFVMLNKYCGERFEESITRAWKKVLNENHLIKIPEEKAIVDLILGAIAIQKKDLEVYALDMKNRGQTVHRIEGVTSSLTALSNSTELMNIDADINMNLSLKPKGNKGRRI